MAKINLTENDDLYQGANPNSPFPGRKDLIFGLGGDDTVLGGKQDDTIYGDYGRDYEDSEQVIAYAETLEGGDGNDVVSFNDLLYGNSGKDWVYGEQGCDTIYGGKGDDHLYGDFADEYQVQPTVELYTADTLDGAQGNDTPTQQCCSNDYIEGNTGDDFISGGKGSDTIYGGGGEDTIEDGKGADLVWGGSENDVLEVGCGADTVDGDSGDDVINLYGDNADDVINTGSGLDTVSFYDSFGTDVIEDFDANPADGQDMVFVGGYTTYEIVIGAFWEESNPYDDGKLDTKVIFDGGPAIIFSGVTGGGTNAITDFGGGFFG